MAGDVGSSHVRTDFGELSDAELVRATRDGSRRAYAALYARHSLSALKYAKTLTSSDADDVVSEAFLKVYAAIKAGRGPEEDFRYYIRSAVRNTYVSMVRARRTVPAGDSIEDVVGDRGADVASLRSFDGSATARAFLSLPSRWQEVLWYTEVEGFTREHTATLLGMNANAVSALSFRAREALRTAWLQQHISAHSDLDRGCEAITPLLGAYSRQGLARRDRLRVEHHVNGCAHCTSVVGELSELLTPGRLALILLPVVVTGGGFAAFAAKFGGGSAAVASASAVAPPTAILASVGGTSAAGRSGRAVGRRQGRCLRPGGDDDRPADPDAHRRLAARSEGQSLGSLVIRHRARPRCSAPDRHGAVHAARARRGSGCVDAPEDVDADADTETTDEARGPQGGKPEASGNANPNASGNGAVNGNANANAGGSANANGAANGNANANAGPERERESQCEREGQRERRRSGQRQPERERRPERERESQCEREGQRERDDAERERERERRIRTRTRIPTRTRTSNANADRTADGASNGDRGTATSNANTAAKGTAERERRHRERDPERRRRRTGESPVPMAALAATAPAKGPLPKRPRSPTASSDADLRRPALRS